eukprot:CAMPEP_0119028550 /NCGR_PEP_ID=MMETSP1176-20130426/39095_1 /TAXON_ID=265551 /ORGANISM="Synedropsis recta cf, Strain CCMP1620" /LENGTH=56 /DNA_ID=CAMNT_0006984709 /DNA_START=614 /DNA_END=782 /DNA_ORIENTATION=+
MDCHHLHLEDKRDHGAALNDKHGINAIGDQGKASHVVKKGKSVDSVGDQCNDHEVK